jgi:branched-chain amino acid transport system permease protein
MVETIALYGIVWAALYALMALGFSLIFSVAKILNLAHGVLIMVACYVIYALVAKLNFPLGVSILAGVAIIALLGILLYAGFIKRLRGSIDRLVLLTGGLAMIMEQAIIISAGPHSKFVPSMVKGSLSIIGVEVSYQQVLSMVIAFILITLLWLFLQRSKTGRAIRAVAQDRDVAALLGINVEKIFTITMAISATLAAMAGILIAPIQAVTPEIGWGMMGTAFAVTTLGGIGSVWGMAIAGAIVAYIELTTAFLISPVLKEAAAFSIMALTLIFKPSGLFGKGEV